jgi:hypothetical protein
MGRKDSVSLEARFVHIGARERRRPYVGAESRAGLLEVEHVALRVAVRSVARKTAAVAARREAANYLATYLAGWS